MRWYGGLLGTQKDFDVVASKFEKQNLMFYVKFNVLRLGSELNLTRFVANQR